MAAEPEARPTALVSPKTAVSVEEVDRSLASSVAWNAICDWGSQIVSWASFLVVMRLLTPADFGIAALAVITLSYLGQITGFGIQRAVVTLRDLTSEQLAQLNSVSFGLGMLCFAFAAVFAWPFAAFFKMPPLAPLLIVACSSLVPSGLQTVSTGLLARNMRFRLLSLLGAASALVSAVVTLGAAYAGLGYWALVLGNLISTTARSIVVLCIIPCRLAWPDFQTIREPLKFCRSLVASTFAFYSYEQTDNLVVGRTLGQATLGLYGTAWELANVPLEKLVTVLVTVVPSYLAAVQNQPAALRRYLRVLTEIVSLSAFPATIGLALVAHEMVPVVFGHKWDGMIPPLEVLLFYAGFRSIVALLPKVLIAVGNARFVMWNDLTALLVLPVAFYIGSFHGTVGVAWGWVVAYPLIAFPLYRKTFQTIDMKIGEYFRAVRPALEGSLAMIVCVELLRATLPSMQKLVVRLGLEVAVGALSYIGALMLLHKTRMLVLIQALYRLRSSRSQVEA
ncbi:MAG: lipopolysaccharide biosynthesis protein [Candidatus Sulfotelmatobacter sp.]